MKKDWYQKEIKLIKPFNTNKVNIGDVGLVTAFLPESDVFAVLFRNGEWFTMSMYHTDFFELVEK